MKLTILIIMKNWLGEWMADKCHCQLVLAFWQLEWMQDKAVAGERERKLKEIEKNRERESKKLSRAGSVGHLFPTAEYKKNEHFKYVVLYNCGKKFIKKCRKGPENGYLNMKICRNWESWEFPIWLI